MSGCAFVESATEITVGGDSLGRVDEDALLTVERVEAALHEAAFDRGDSTRIDLPYDASWRDLRNALCTAWVLGILDDPALDFVEIPESENLRGLSFRVGAVGADDIPCHLTSVRLEASAEFVPFTEAQARKIQRQLPTDLEKLTDAIRQVRVRFNALGLAQIADDGSPLLANHLLSSFELLLSDPGLADDPATPFHDGQLEIVPAFLLHTIVPGVPRRFELDPQSPVTAAMADAIVSPKDHRMVFSLRFEVAPAQLALIPVHNTGVTFRFEFELVVAALAALL